MKRTLPWTPALAIALTIGALVPAPAAAQDQIPATTCRADALDPLGDTPRAPDIGTFYASVVTNGAYRRVVAGTWLDRSDLPWGDLVAWQIDVGSGGQPDFGGDYLIGLDGYGGTPDTWATYRWTESGWVEQELGNAALWTFPDGRVYWHFDLSTVSTPQTPVTIGLRAITQHTEGSYWWRDYAPNAFNLPVSLEPHGPADPLEGYGYGSCVGGASGPGAYGPKTNTPTSGTGGPQLTAACTSARSALRAVRKQLRRAKAAKRRATSRVVRRRHTRAVKRLTSRRDRLARRVAARC
jgi:hypothetical protein